MPASTATKSELTSFTVSLPRSLKDYLQAQSVQTGCSTPSEYIRRLLYADQREREKERLEQALLKGLSSPAHEMTPARWNALKQRVLKTAAQRRAKRSD
jgi:antitoxin ParD1/3/4